MDIHRNSSSRRDVLSRGTFASLRNLSPAHRAAKALIVGAMLAMGAHSAQAAADTWVGSTSANFSTLNGFNTIPASGDSLLFNTAGAAGTTLNDDLTTTAFNIAGFTFNAGASAFTIGGNSFALTGGITNNSTNLQTINDAFSMAAPQIFTTTTGGGNLKFGGVISGAGGLTAAEPAPRHSLPTTPIRAAPLSTAVRCH